VLRRPVEITNVKLPLAAAGDGVRQANWVWSKVAGDVRYSALCGLNSDLA